MLKVAALIVATISLLITVSLPAHAACNVECQRRCSISVARGDPGPQYQSQAACERYWGKLNQNPQKARSEMNRVNQDAARRNR